MPLFISDAELQAAGTDVALVAERADGHIRDLLQQLEAQKARADAAWITAEQRGAVVEQKFLAMSSQFKHMEGEKTQLENTLERRSVELAQAQAQVHKLELESMKQDSDREHFLCELNEVRKARRELLEVVEQKNAELFEKNTYIKTYLDKIVSLTDERSNLEGKVRVAEAEMARFQGVQARLSQEKELLEQHNSWLNEELTDKVDTLLKERRSSSDMEMELLSKLARAEQVCKEMGESLQRNKEQVKDLELRLTQTREELRFTKEDAASKEDHLSLEVETASKLAELYKQSSEEWSNKAIDLEGVIKALEVHLNQVEAESKERLEKEVEACKTSEKNAMDAKEEMEKLEKELELYKKGKEKESLFLISDFSDAAPKELDLSDRKLLLELHEDGPLLPIVPSGISGTALAAALLRDGWSITKIYIKYQEAADAWRHERQERRQSQALLQRVLQEIEQRADLILDERAEHARMVEAYTIMEEKLHRSVEEQSSLENQIRELKAELRKRERDLNGTKQECSDLQSQVVVLLKECADIKQRYGGENFQLKGAFERLESTPAVTASDDVISERLLTFKNIHEIVEQNSQLRAIVRSLGHQNEEREMELKEAFDSELKKRTDDAAQKVSTILRRSEEQTQLITSLQGTVGMYRRLYEEDMKARSKLPKDNGIMTVAETSGDDVRSLIVRSQEDIEKVRKEASERLSVLEADLNKARQDASVARMERDRLIVEATYAREQLQTIVKDSENQRKEMDAVLARNVEFSQIITDYQKRLRENAEHVQSVEEKSRRLSVEVSVLEREKELISIAERRASQELSSLSDCVHKLQARLDNIHTVEEAQEIMRAGEKKKLEEEVNRMQKEWVGMKHELDSERAHIRHLSKEGDQVVKQAMDRIESISKELADALQKVSMSETRANVAEARCTELEANLKKSEEKILVISSRRKLGKNSKDMELEPDTEVLSLLEQAKEDIDRLKEELDASKNHTDQYKQLAQLNEEALLRMEDAHNHFKEEAEKTKESLGSELSSLREKATNLEKLLSDKENELVEAEAHKERVLSTAEKEIMLVRESDSGKRILLEQAEERIKALKCELEKEHQLWRTAQNNYERQVLLQADTIRELTMVSESKGHLEKEVMEFRTKAELSMSELGSSRVVWEMEKASLLSENESLISKLRELEEQNRILLDRVEATHILVGEHDKKFGNFLESSEHVGNDLQDVIRYLRRSKETSEMEISLLKQERLRLQKQRESALHAAEEAQANLRREHENTRVTLCSEEEFKSLQAQVREMTLLRESNAQLRLENERNFEECQSLREKMQNKQAEVESLRKLLREREVELDATVKDVDLQKAEIARWENRVSQLLQKYKSVDPEEYNRAQSELTSSQETLRLQQAELDATKGELQKLKEVIRNLEGEILIKDETIGGLEKRVKEAEVSAKAETDKFRKQMFLFKRKIENLTKEKDDMRDTLSKQLEELKASANKRGLGESHRSEAQIRQEMVTQYEQAQKENENLLKEKETRIQMLERTLEREREDLKKEREELRKEKQRRMKDQRTYYDFAQKQDLEKQKLMEELSSLKRDKDNFSENVQAKKFGRKIVRPRIESHIQPEASESGNELATEVPEAEAEIRDDTKLASTAVTEVLESVGTTSAIVVASTSSAPLTDDVVTGLRKRPSAQAHGSMEEASLGQGNKNEATPAHKKQKGLDLKAIVVESDTVPTVITESLVTVEASKVLEMDVEHATAGDPATSDRNDLNTLATTEVQQMVNVIENNQGIRPSVQTETSAPKRPRIVRSDVFHPLSTAIQRVDVMDEKTVTAEAELFPESASTGERDEQSFVPVDEHLHYDSQGPYSSPHRTEIIVGSTESGLRNPMQLTVVDAPDIAALQPPSQESFLASEMEGTENLLIDLNDAPDVLVASSGIPTSSEPEVAITISAVERVSEMGTPVEFRLPKAVETNIITDVALTDSGVDVEDGEIEPDDSEDSIVESVPHQMSMDAPDEDKNSGGLSLDLVGKDAQQPDEIPRDEKLLLNTELLQMKDLGASEGSAVDQKVEGMHSENIRSQRLTRQLGKGTTIFLSERAKEGSVSKRSGMLPPSPGKRNPRGTKRSLGLQQGRTNPPVGEPEGDEEAKRGGTQQSGSHSAPTDSNSDALREEE